MGSFQNRGEWTIGAGLSSGFTIGRNNPAIPIVKRHKRADSSDLTTAPIIPADEILLCEDCRLRYVSHRIPLLGCILQTEKICGDCGGKAVVWVAPLMADSQQKIPTFEAIGKANKPS